MKKIYFLIIFTFLLIPNQTFAKETKNTVLVYQSAASLKSEMVSLNRQIDQNELKIRRIRSSRNLSENEKRRQINSLETRNRTLQRKINKMRYEYSRALSFS